MVPKITPVYAPNVHLIARRVCATDTTLRAAETDLHKEMMGDDNRRPVTNLLTLGFVTHSLTEFAKRKRSNMYGSRCSLASVALRPALCIHGLAATPLEDAGMPIGGIGGAGGGCGLAVGDDVFWSAQSRDFITSHTISPVPAVRYTPNKL